MGWRELTKNNPFLIGQDKLLKEHATAFRGAWIERVKIIARKKPDNIDMAALYMVTFLRRSTPPPSPSDSDPGRQTGTLLEWDSESSLDPPVEPPRGPPREPPPRPDTGYLTEVWPPPAPEDYSEGYLQLVGAVQFPQWDMGID